MQQVLEFITHHWILVSLFIAILILVIAEEVRTQGGGRQGLSPQALTNLINRESIAIVDIRDNNTFLNGYIIGSINIPAESLDQNIKRIEKYKQQPVVIVCTTGQKAPSVASRLKKLGFEKIHVLAGGINAWRSADMPLVKK